MICDGAADLAYQVPTGMHLRSWGESTDVVYLESTRHTHLVDAASALFLKMLAEAGGQATVRELWARLDPGPADFRQRRSQADSASSTDDETEWCLLRDRLEQLVAAGLVYRAC